MGSTRIEGEIFVQLVNDPIDPVDGQVWYNTTTDEFMGRAGGVDVTFGFGEANTSSNSGIGEGLAKAKNGVDLPFKSLSAGDGIELSSDADEVTIAQKDVSCKITKSAVQSIAKNVFTIISWNQESYDTDSMHDNATNNSRITINTAGKYLINAQAEWASNNQGERVLHILKNGTNVISSTRHLADNGSEHVVSGIHEFAVGDYIEVSILQSSNGDLDFSTGVNVINTYLAVQKLT